MNSLNGNHQILGNQFLPQNGPMSYDNINFYGHPPAGYFSQFPMPPAQYQHLAPMHLPYQNAQPLCIKPNNPQTPSSETRSETSESCEDTSAAGATTPGSGPRIHGCQKKKACVPVPEEKKDDNYWRKRNKNNESARKSREQKKLKAVRVAEDIVRSRQEIEQIEREIAAARYEYERYMAEYDQLQSLCRKLNIYV